MMMQVYLDSGKINGFIKMIGRYTCIVPEVTEQSETPVRYGQHAEDRLLPCSYLSNLE